MRKTPLNKAGSSARDLPHTRREQFFDLIVHQPRTILSSSLLLTLFSLPLIAVYIVFNVFIGAAAQRGDGVNVIFSLLFYGVLIAIPCWTVLVVGLSGSFNVAKKLIFGEGVLLNVAFYYGLKENWKRSIVMGVLSGLSFALMLFGSVYLLFFYQTLPVLIGVGIGLLVIQFLIVGIMTPYYLSQQCIYQNSILANLKNSFLMALMKIHINIPLFIAAPGVVIGLMMINDITAYIAIGLFVFFNFVGVLLWNLYICYVFDRFINSEHYPEFVNKGLAKKEE